jgi:tetratricopeptide (TPR) repeat protein
LSDSFKPGDDFYDHFDLALFEHPDYYPDGRDLGENYTYTSWSMSPCVKEGNLDCLQCHTSSGRFIQNKDPNQACMPCHADRVQKATYHTNHKADGEGNLCISCHMPKTSFARMNRSDHSMLPPSPSATMAFGSPNACNKCHTDKDPAWADEWVRKWRKRDFQAEVLKRGGLIKAARERDWSKLAEMLDYLQDPEREEITAASLVRLLQPCPQPEKWPVIIQAASDPAPLVRASAVDALIDHPTPASRQVLLASLEDQYRLVRIRAAGSLAAFSSRDLPPAKLELLQKATWELEASLMTRPDLWSSHYNVGNYLMERRQNQQAITAYNMALKLEPRALMVRVNLAMAHARQGQTKQAEMQLDEALGLDPTNAAANYNQGLLAAEQKDNARAERHLRAALKSDPQMAQAAYNLGLLIYERDPVQGVDLVGQAWNLRPSPRYAFSLAYLLKQSRRNAKAVELLRTAKERWPWFSQAYLMLAELQTIQGDVNGAVATLTEGIGQESMPLAERRRLQEALLRHYKPPMAPPTTN